MSERDEMLRIADDLDRFVHDMMEDGNDATALWLKHRADKIRRLATTPAGYDDYPGNPHNERAANARLIAAAPELLAALQVLLGEAEGFNVSGVYFDEPCMGHKGPDMARAAIAKAEG